MQCIVCTLRVPLHAADAPVGNNIALLALLRSLRLLQVLLSAPGWTQLNPKWFDWGFLFVYFSVKGYFLLKKVYESIKAVDFCGKLI